MVSSEAANQRAEKSASKARQREFEAIEKQLFHLQAQCFESQEAAMSECKVYMDEHGYKFGGDASESPTVRGKGSSSNSRQDIRGEDKRVLSDRAERRLESLLRFQQLRVESRMP